MHYTDLLNKGVLTSQLFMQSVLSVVIVLKEGEDTKQRQCVIHLLNKGVLTLDTNFNSCRVYCQL